MSLSASTSLWVAGLLTVFGVTAFTYLSLAMVPSPLGLFLGRYPERLERYSRFIRASWSGATLAQMQLIFALAIAFASVVLQSSLLLLLTGAILTVPAWFLQRLHRSRVTRLEEQLDGWLLMLSNALSASPSIGEALASTANLVSAPLREELDFVIKEIRLGTSLDEALQNTARRIQSPIVSGALATLVLARQTGGSLPKILEDTACTLRESARLEGVLRAKTAEGRGQVIALAAMPFVLCSVIVWMDPSWFEPMGQQPAGQLILLICAFTWALALLWARRIVDVAT